MLDMLREDVFGETLDAHKAKVPDKDAADDWFSKGVLTTSSFMGSVSTYVRRETDTAMNDKKHSSSF